MSALNKATRATLAEYGLTPQQWAKRYFGTTEWGGDSCGCPDDRCIGFHHADTDDCGCLLALLERSEPC